MLSERAWPSVSGPVILTQSLIGWDLHNITHCCVRGFSAFRWGRGLTGDFCCFLSSWHYTRVHCGQFSASFRSGLSWHSVVQLLLFTCGPLPTQANSLIAFCI